MAQATLNGFLDDDGGLPTEAMFEWGMTNDYGMKTPWQPATIGVQFSATIMNLCPGQAYHFRAVGRNANGDSYGADMTFSTLGELGLPTLVDEFDILRLIGAIE